MKKIPAAGLAMCLLIMMLFSVVSATAQTCKPESIPATTPASRFTDNGDGTVTDKETGLMWKQCTEGLSDAGCGTGSLAKFTWKEALKRAQEVNAAGFAGHSDWRVPNIKELRSIVEEQCYEPAINISVFPNTPPCWYCYFWSSSTFDYSGNGVWVCSFFEGHDSTSHKLNSCYVRLVRGGQ